MTQPVSRTLKRKIEYWWLFLVTGIALMGVGMWVIASPLNAYASLSILFAAGILVTGTLEATFALTARHSIDGWIRTLLAGVLDIAVAIYLLIHPAVTLNILPFILGFWLLFRGVSAIGLALDMKSYHMIGWGILLTIGILILLFGSMVMAVPVFGVFNIIVWTSLSFISAGFFRMVLAFRLKRLSQFI